MMNIRNAVATRHFIHKIVSRFSSKSGENMLINILSNQGGISVQVAEATKLINDACTAHKCSQIASVALGRTMVGNMLLAHGRDNNETCQVQINGNGVLGRITSECVLNNGIMGSRGYVQYPQAQQSLREDGTLDISGAVGIGMVQVRRSHPAWKEPFSGSVMLETSEIAEDLAVYLCSSEQTNSVLWLFVDADHEGSVKTAMGYLCSVLPGCSEEELNILEHTVTTMPNLQQAVKQGNITADGIADLLINGLGEQFRHYVKVEGRCTCSKEKFLRGMLALGRDELEDMIKKKEDIDVSCDWCNKSTRIAWSDLQELVST